MIAFSNQTLRQRMQPVNLPVFFLLLLVFFLQWYAEGANQRIWNLESQVAGQCV